MDCKEELLIFAKTGAIFAKCDGSIDVTEKNVITGIKENERFVSYSGNINEECEPIIDFYNAKDKKDINSYLFDELVSETKDYLDNLGDDEQEVFIKDLDKFIDSIIKADGKELYSENSLFIKWRKEIYKYINMEVPPKQLQEELKKAKNISDDSKEEPSLVVPVNKADGKEKKDSNKAKEETDKKIREQEVKIKKQELKVKKQETKSKKQEIKAKKQETKIKKLEAKAKKLEAMSPICKYLHSILRLFLIGLIFIAIFSFVYWIIDSKNKETLEAFPLSSYTEKMLQFKEIDFSKVLIYGTETDAKDRDSLLLYFAKGTAVLRFRGLDSLSIDSSLSTGDTLFLNCNIENQTALPIDVEIIYDESKCRLIDSFEATTLKDSPFGTGIKTISTIAGTTGGMYAGQAIGGLFGLNGQLIGLASGAVVGGLGSYIASANFVKKTKLVKDNTSSTIRDMLEDAKPIIAAQLLSDETITQSTDQNELDIQKLSIYYRQQMADILTNLICSDENNKWEHVEIRFVGDKKQKNL